MTSSSTGAKPGPLLDEAGFEQLLAAAYVLQQHNDDLRAKNPHLDPVAVLSEMVEANSHDDTREISINAAISADSGLEEMLDTSFGITCRACGHQFGEDEEFCGGCGLARDLAISSENLQGKWASLWYKQQAQAAVQEDSRTSGDARSRPPTAPIDEPSPVRPEQPEENLPSGKMEETIAHAAVPSVPFRDFADRKTSWPFAATPEVIPSPTSAGSRATSVLSSAQAMVEGLRHRVRTRPRHAAIAMASAALLLLLILWSLWPAGVSAKTEQGWFDAVLAKVGLENAPARATAYSGNPDVRVWVDVHTALYYCPGSDLYGKTPGGHFSRQRTAQKDQFESASGNACQ